MKKSRTRKITLAAVFSAFSVMFLYLASVFPTGQLGFLGISSLFGAVAVCEYGVPGGVLVFVVTALIGFMIVPDKTGPTLYAVFFGYYPILKSVAEKLRSRVLEWALKLIVFSVALSVVLFVFRLAFYEFELSGWLYAVAYFVGNMVFIIFDLGVSRVLAVYMSKIYPKIHAR